MQYLASRFFKAIFSLLFLVGVARAEAPDWYSRLGGCIANPLSSGPGFTMNQDWEAYRTRLELKVKYNIPALAAMAVPAELTEFLNNLIKLGPFNVPIVGPVAGGDPSVAAAIDYFNERKISLKDPLSLASAQRLYVFFRSKNWSDTKLLKDFPFPSSVTPSPGKGAAVEPDEFENEFLGILTGTIGRFLKTRPLLVSDGLDPATVAELNALEPPAQDNAFDSFLLKTYPPLSATLQTPDLFGKTYSVSSATQLATIDGLARTLWGEARGCEVADLPQFEAIGLVIVNRANLIEQGSPQGISDFGRPGSLEPPVAQVISKPQQFSVWNGFSPEAKRLSAITPRVPAGIPDVNFSFMGPLNANDEMALNHILCPQISPQIAGDVAAWQRAVDLATVIVLDPARYEELFSFTPNPTDTILFYAHGDDLRFALEQTEVSGVQELHTNGGTTVRELRGSGHGTCDELRLFSARAGASYSPKPIHSPSILK